MSFDCKNPAPPANCGKYVKAYIGNMEWAAQGILDIIKNNILTSESGPNDITKADCSCKEICDAEGKPTGCLPTGDAKVFNCKTWYDIKDLLLDVSNIPTDDQGFITLVCQTIKCFLEKTPKIHHGFATQMERFLCLTESFSTRLEAVCCTNNCPELIGDLLCLLMQILTGFISAITKAATLMYYNDCEVKQTTENKVVKSFFECMLCDFINDLCELEKLLQELSALIMALAYCDYEQCTPCYTTPSVPRKVRPMCPPNAINYGGGYPYQRPSGCGCSCKK